MLRIGSTSYVSTLTLANPQQHRAFSALFTIHNLPIFPAKISINLPHTGSTQRIKFFKIRAAAHSIILIKLFAVGTHKALKLNEMIAQKKERLTAFPFFVRANVFYLRRRYAANARASNPAIAAQVAGSGIIALV